MKKEVSRTLILKFKAHYIPERSSLPNNFELQPKDFITI